MTTNLKRRLASGESGFTLIELLVVMIIISILMAVAIPSFLGQKQKAVASTVKTSLKNVTDAIEGCQAGLTTGSYMEGTAAAPAPNCASYDSINGNDASIASTLDSSLSSAAVASVGKVKENATGVLSTDFSSVASGKVMTGVLCAGSAPDCQGYWAASRVTRGTDSVWFLWAKSVNTGDVVKSCSYTTGSGTSPTVDGTGYKLSAGTGAVPKLYTQICPTGKF